MRGVNVSGIRVGGTVIAARHGRRRRVGFIAGGAIVSRTVVHRGDRIAETIAISGRVGGHRWLRGRNERIVIDINRWNSEIRKGRQVPFRLVQRFVCKVLREQIRRAWGITRLQQSGKLFRCEDRVEAAIRNGAGWGNIERRITGEQVPVKLFLGLSILGKVVGERRLRKEVIHRGTLKSRNWRSFG